MKTLLLSLWILAPIGVGAYHLGPGQDRLRADEAGEWIATAKAQLELAAQNTGTDEVAAGAAYAKAKAAIEEALALLPDDSSADALALRRGLRLERAKCRMFTSELPQANSELGELVRELADDPEADAAQLVAARDAFANSQYYMTWLLRLEGAGRADWEPRIESARQIYRLLAESAEARGDQRATTRFREDLEAAIRLERMEIGELQGLPLPSQ